MKKFVLFVLAAATLFAQQKEAPAPPPPLAPNEVIRIVEVKNATASLIRYTLSQLFTGVTESNGRLIIRGQPAVVSMIEDAIKKLDVPPPTPPERRPPLNVELTIQLLQGAAQEGTAGTMPADLEPIIRQLRSSFAYKSYKLLDTELLRAAQQVDSQINGTLPGGTSGFEFHVRSGVEDGTSPRRIRLSRLDLHLKQYIPNGNVYDARISGEFDAKEGQKIVVGKANLVNSDDAIFLVITPKVIE